MVRLAERRASASELRAEGEPHPMVRLAERRASASELRAEGEPHPMVRLVLLTVFLAACQPDLGPSSSVVNRLRLLAVQMEPAEVVPGTVATYTALVGDANGPASPTINWSYCLAPKPLNENNTVASACLFDPTMASVLGAGPSVMANVPVNACALFGSSPPPQDPTSPPLRPRDPDVTGGYYQPIRVDDSLEPTFALQRITCDLANATTDQTIAYRMTYKANTNPTLTAVSARASDGSELDLNALPANTAITLHAEWLPEAAETFPVFDLNTRTLRDSRESLRVSWYVTGGTLLLDRSGRASDDLEVFAENTWATPPPGPAHLWAVLRDSRGGVGWLDYAVTMK